MHTRRIGEPGKLIPLIERCASCNGAGKIEEWCAGHVMGAKLCDSCNGSGRKSVTRRRRTRLSANI